MKNVIKDKYFYWIKMRISQKSCSRLILDWRHDNPHRKLLQQRYSLFNDIRKKDFWHTPGGGDRETRSGSGGREGRPGEGRDFFGETFRSTRVGRTIEMRLLG